MPSATEASGTRLQRALRGLFGALFLALVLTPNLVALLWRDGAYRMADERRSAAPLPRLPRGVDELLTWPARFDVYYQDSFGLRGTMIGAHSRLRWFLLGESPTERLLRGHEGWVFYCEGDPLETLRAQSLFSPAALEAALDTLAARRSWTRARGAEFLFVLVPDKSTLYASNVPEPFRPLHGTRREQLLAGAAQRDDVRLLDVLPALREELRHDTPDDTTYNRYGTHWSERGAQAGYRAIVAELAKEFRVPPAWPREDFEAQPDIDAEGDSWSGRLYLDGALLEAFYSYRPLRPRQAVRVTDEELPYHGRHYRHPDASLPRAVIVHDSFGNLLLPLLAEHFSETWTYWRPEFDTLLLEGHEVDVVIHVQVERRLRSGPPNLSEEIAGAYLAERFARSESPRLHLEGEQLVRDVQPRRRTLATALDDGLELRIEGPADSFMLPAFESPGDGSAVLRLDITSPVAGPMIVLYRTRDEAEYGHERAYAVQLVVGRQRVHLQIAAQDQFGPLVVHPGREAGRFVLHAVDVRVCDLR